MFCSNIWGQSVQQKHLALLQQQLQRESTEAPRQEATCHGPWLRDRPAMEKLKLPGLFLNLLLSYDWGNNHELSNIHQLFEGYLGCRGFDSYPHSQFFFDKWTCCQDSGNSSPNIAKHTKFLQYTVYDISLKLFGDFSLTLFHRALLVLVPPFHSLVKGNAVNTDDMTDDCWFSAETLYTLGRYPLNQLSNYAENSEKNIRLKVCQGEKSANDSSVPWS